MSSNQGIKKASQLNEFGDSGPFEVLSMSGLDGIPTSEFDHPPEGPVRRYECCNYETCLNLAAALNWDSFTCRKCKGEMNQKLLWRAQHEMRKDKMAKAICNLPDAKERRIENPISADGCQSNSHNKSCCNLVAMKRS